MADEMQAALPVFFISFLPISKSHDLPSSHHTPLLLTPTKTKCSPLGLIFEIFRWVANSASAPPVYSFFTILSPITGMYARMCQIKSNRYRSELQAGLYPSG